MRYCKNKITGRIINTQGGSGNIDDLYTRNSLDIAIEDQEVGEADDTVVNGWLATQDEADKTYSDKRKSEYPTIEELVVALYDTDDKAAIEKRRADVKAKYPKP